MQLFISYSCVGIFLELVHNFLVCSLLSSSPARRSFGNVCCECVQVHEKVDSSVGEDRHTTGMVLGWVNVIDADGVSAKFLHQCSVGCALSGVEKRIALAKLVGDTWRMLVEGCVKVI